MKESEILAHGPKGPRGARADPRVVDETPQMVPAEVGATQEDIDRSICESDSGISSKGSNGKPRVPKVARGKPKDYITDPKERLATIGP